MAQELSPDLLEYLICCSTGDHPVFIIQENGRAILQEDNNNIIKE